MKSHIQMPKFLMKNFAHKNDGFKTFLLDTETLEIRDAKIKHLGTEEGFYSDEVEAFLSTNVEQVIGKVTRSFKDFSKNKMDTLPLSVEDDMNVKNFMKYSLIRSEQVRNIANERSLYAKYVGGYSTNDIIQYNKVFLEMSFLNDHQLCALTNSSDIDFIAPRNCFYSGIVEGKPTKYIMPINSSIAFLLLHKNEFEEMKKVKKASYYHTDDGMLVRNYNMRAYIDEKHINNKFVISKKKETLEILLDDLNARSLI